MRAGLLLLVLVLGTDATAAGVRRIADRRCKTRGGCLDKALVRIFPGGVPDSLVATGFLASSRGGFANTRASSKACTRANGTVTFLGVNTICVERAGVYAESASTNLFLRSTEMENAAWPMFGITVTANSVAAPDGTLTADTVGDDGLSGYHIHRQQVFNGSAGNLTQSVFAKAGTQTCLQLAAVSNGASKYANFNLAAGTVSSTGGTASITALAGGWYRLTWTLTDAIVNETFQHVFKDPAQPCTGAGGLYQGTGAYLYLWGAQAEAHPFASSPIATAGTTAARAADQIKLTGISLPLGTRPSFSYDVLVKSHNTTREALATYATGVRWGMFYLSGTPGLLDFDYNNGTEYNSILSGAVAGVSHHVTADYDGAILKGCIIGVGCSTPTWSFTALQTMTSVALGYSGWSAQNYLDGWLSNVCISDKSEVCR